MTEDSVRVLLVEDEVDDAYLLEAELAQLPGARFQIVHVTRASDARDALEQGGIDVVLLDLGLPDASGLEALQAVCTAAPRVPILVLTGLEDEDVWSRAQQAGAQDYLIKGQTGGGPTVARAIRYAMERKRTELELEDLNRQKDEFLAIAAHDLRGPLGHVIGFSEILEGNLEEAGDEESLQLVSFIRRQAKFMHDLVDDLLDIQQIQAGHLALSRIPVDLQEFVRRNVEMNQSLGRNKQIEFELQTNGTVGPLALDPARMEQVLNNLISNAVKYSPARSRVEVRVGREGERAVISVADEGPGIPSEEVDRLFKPFGTTSVRPIGEGKSTGLGLAIVKRIVDGHGGEIVVETELGRGSTFHVYLPVRTR